MRKYRIIEAFIALLVISSLAGCQAGDPSPSPASSPLKANTSPVPTATVAETSESESDAQKLVFPTSQPGLATVTGSISRQGSEANLEKIELYLGEVIETSDPKRPVVGLDKAIAPKAILDVNTGDFAFYNVPPGKYALEIVRPLVVPILVSDPETGKTLVITLEADSDIELGSLPVTIPE